MNYLVKRRHQGDRLYEEGDTREASPADVAHLVERGVLVEQKREPKHQQKPEAKLSNKAQKVGANK